MMKKKPSFMECSEWDEGFFIPEKSHQYDT